MSRYPKVDKNSVLDAAEKLMRAEGITALTIASVAKAAGISKGGIQSSFGSKEALITAMYDRWTADFEATMAKFSGHNPTPWKVLCAHIEATLCIDDIQEDRAVGMMISMLNAPNDLEDSQKWYASRLEGIDMKTIEGRRARIALMATEGAFLLNAFGFMKMTPQEKSEIYSDIKSLLSSETEQNI